VSVQPILTAALKTEQDVVHARQRARTLAGLLGFDRQDQTRIATAVSEIARNTVTYGRGGTLRFTLEGSGRERALAVSFIDQGSGIAGLNDILEGHYVSPTGMGLGIVGTRRLMDTFEIESAPGRGTHVRFSKYLPPGRAEIDIRQLTIGLTTASPTSLAEEVQVQNRDLLSTLADLGAARGELGQINTELENTNRGVVALYAELDERAEELRRASEIKTQFLSNMSHELRTPLHSIMALSRLLSDQVDGPLNTEQLRQVTYISHSAEALTALVNDLLDLAKVEAGHVDLHAKEFTTTELLGALRGVMRPLLTSDHVELVIEDRTQGLALHTDEGKLAQILRNLVSNALKFTEQGQVRVEVSTRPPGRIEFVVRDTGVGIPPSELTRIFDEFVQVKNPLQSRHKGSGLGLPLSRKLAGLLGGLIDVESTPGVGSVFTVDIPVMLPEAEAAPVDSGPSRLKILIVDDEEPTRYVLRQALSTEPDWTVLEAADGTEGLRLAQSETPDFVVLDLNMPGLDGFEVFRTLKGDPATAGIPILVVTSALLTTEVLKRLEGSIAVLPKSNLSRAVLRTLAMQALQQAVPA
jgi:signal transduction histidine kinase/ActR/RegA family two-component response regulator